MPTASRVSQQHSPASVAPTEWADTETGLVRAILAKEPIITLTGAAGSGKTRLLDRMTPLLMQSKIRVIRVRNPTDAVFDRKRLLEQVIDAAPNDGRNDPVERLLSALTGPRDGESQVALIIDDAHTLAPDAFDCLGLVVSVAQAGPIPLQVVLAGRPEMWERFPQQRFLALEGITTRLVLRRRKAAAAADVGLIEALFGPGSWPLVPEIIAFPSTISRDTQPDRLAGPPLVSPGQGIAEPVREVPPPVVPRQRPGSFAWIPLSVGFLVAVGGVAVVYFAPGSGGPRPTGSPVQLDRMISAPFDFAPHQGEPKKAMLAAATATPAYTAPPATVELAPTALPPAIVSLLARGDRLLEAGNTAGALQLYAEAIEIAQDITVPEASGDAGSEANAPPEPEAAVPSLPEAPSATAPELADQATPEAAQTDPTQALAPPPVSPSELTREPREAVREVPAPLMPSPPTEAPGAATPEFAGPATPEPAQTDPVQALAPPPVSPAELTPEPREAVGEAPAPLIPTPSPEIPNAATPEFASPTTPEPAQTDPVQALAPPPVSPAELTPEPREAVGEAPAPLMPSPPTEAPGAATPSFAGPATPAPAQIDPAQALAPQPMPPSDPAPEPREAVREVPAPVAPSPPDTAQPSRDAAAAAPVPPIVAPTTPTSRPAMGAALMQVLLARGDDLIATGDVVAARLMYERAATGGSSRAAIATGMTYDPSFLLQLGARGIVADPRAAAGWYRRAADLGDAAAPGLLARLGPAGQ